MAQKSRSIGNELNSWTVCKDGHKANSADFPFLKTDVVTFEKLIEQAKSENSKQEQLKSELAAQSKVVNGLMAAGRKSYASLIRYAKAKYGPNSAKIKVFLSKTEGVSKPKKAKAG